MQQVGSSTFNSGQICMCEIRLSKEVLIVILGKLREIAEDGPHLPTVYCGAQFVSTPKKICPLFYGQYCP